jgi:pyruvate formate lyase activating enzyme
MAFLRRWLVKLIATRYNQGMSSLSDFIDPLSTPAELSEKLSNGDVRCLACAHRCLLHPGRRGICQVRFNQDGVLLAPWGYVAAAQIDPIEKKPFSHLLPGRDALTFGMLGCDFHCAYCQNWYTSQALRDPGSEGARRLVQKTSPAQLANYAEINKCGVLVSSYNEPLITSEWAAAIFDQAHQRGLLTAYVSNGNATPEVLRYLRPRLDAYKVDLKCMQDQNYRRLGGVLQHVLDTIQFAHDTGLWVEVVTLVIPGFNDSNAELWDAARFLATVSPDIPWHVTAYHPDYQMDDAPPTPPATLLRAAEIGQEAGLHYVYAGNLPGKVGNLEDTQCPKCQARLIERRGYVISAYRITPDGCCPSCGAKIAGVWPREPEKVRLAGPGIPRRLGF